MNFNLSDFLTFDKMITPTILKVIYYVLMVVVLLAGIAALFAALMSGRQMLAGLFSALIFLVLGPLMVRMYCELLAVLFEIHKNLREINDRGRQTTGYPQAPPPPQAVPGWNS